MLVFNEKVFADRLRELRVGKTAIAEALGCTVDDLLRVKEVA